MKFQAKALTTLLLFLCFISFGVIRVASIWNSDAESLTTYFEDDAYYYLTIARNVVNEHKLTFDGSTVTNGFHPLWLISVLPAYALSEDNISAMRIVGSISVVLMVIAGLMALNFIRKRYTIFITITCTLILLRYVRDFGAMSMETSILLPLCIAALSLLNKLNRTEGYGRYLLLGVLLSLIMLARLDAVMLCILMVIAAMMKVKANSSVRTGKSLILIVGPPIFVGISYLIANLVFFNTMMPVSGSMKSAFFSFNQLFASQLFLLSDPLGVRSPWGLYLFFLIIVIVGGFIKSYIYLHDNNRYCNLWKSSSAFSVSIFLILFVLIYLFFSNWRLWSWYSYPAVLFTVFCLPQVLKWTGHRIKKSFKLPSRIFLKNDKLALLAGIGLMVCSVVWGLNYRKDVSEDFRCLNRRIALQLNMEMNSDAIIAMGDRSGSFAYFFNGHVLQIEGLVGSSELVDSIETGCLENYLSNYNVDYILTYTGPVGVSDYGEWGLLVPDQAQSSQEPNTLYVHSDNELYRWNNETDTVIIWEW